MSAASEPLATFDELVEMSKHPKFVGIGETGLDYHYTAESAEYSKKNPCVSISPQHAKQACPLSSTRAVQMMTWPAFLEEEHANGAYSCVMHCFSSSPELARAALDLGFYLSMSGISTFPKSQEVRDILAAAPVERVLVETGCTLPCATPTSGQTQ